MSSRSDVSACGIESIAGGAADWLLIDVHVCSMDVDVAVMMMICGRVVVRTRLWVVLALMRDRRLHCLAPRT